MSSQSPIILVANWKMNGTTTQAKELLQSIQSHPVPKHTHVVICPPFTLLHTLKSSLQTAPLLLGAQDCHFEESGAFTGDISPSMLVDAGCRYVILGHSERRNYHQESNHLIHKKAAAAHAAKLITVICIGETQDEYQQGRTQDVVFKQLEESLPASSTHQNTIIAYEPVWSIGTGNVPNCEEIQAIHQAIRSHLASLFASPDAVSILYGGSVKPDNAADILGIKGVNGLLVGGSSLQASPFCSIMEAVDTAICHH
ncbi:MAG: triose-phosphate isomerase [Alphaproteobacteria bacterium]|nr:triose-phosphate isomerase [Alphaproteobacteria bacterium]